MSQTSSIAAEKIFDGTVPTEDGTSPAATESQAEAPVPDQRQPVDPLRSDGIKTADRTAAQRRARWLRKYVIGIALGDTVAIAWAVCGAHMVHMGNLSSRVSRDPNYLPYVALTVVLGLAWSVALQLGGTRDQKILGDGPEEYKRVIQTSLALFGLIAISSYVLDLHLPRAYVLVTLPAGLIGLVLARFTWRRWMHGQRLLGNGMSSVLVVGNLHTVRELLADLRRAPLAGYTVTGICVQENSALEALPISEVTGLRMLDGIPIIGNLRDVADAAREHAVDAVAVTATAAFGPAAVRSLSWDLEKTDIQLILAPALTNIAGPRIHTKPIAGLPLILVDRPTYRGANRILKKSFDLIGSLVLLLVASPLFIGVAIAIKVTSRGPVFFRQERVGINGKHFRMIKFRSMVVDAEAKLAALREQHRDAGNDILFKMKNDPRITKIGKFIRRVSLDELPQLLNVVKGDMSLVGPRPPLQSEADLYGDDARRRLLVKPGMTGLWQVSGRSDLAWDDTVRLDVYYVENWSITGDLVILWKTAKAVASSSGAY